MLQNLPVKLPFTSNVIHHCKFIERLENWLSIIDIEMFLSKERFRYIPHFITKIDSEFFKKVVIYSISHRFQYLFLGVDDQMMLKLNGQIKEGYFGMNVGFGLKNNQHFYYICVLVTKIGSRFIEQNFQNVMIDHNFESEIFKIVVFVFLGLNVNEKMYHLNVRKIIKPSESKISKKIQFHQETTFSQETQTKISNNRLKTIEKETKKRLKINRFISRSNSCFKETKCDDFDEFKFSLKKNLVVNVLPKVVRKKLTIDDLDSIVNRDSQKKIQKDKDRIKFINATQKSSSFEMNMTMNNLESSSSMRDVKLHYRSKLLLKQAKYKIADLNRDQKGNTINQPKKATKECNSGDWKEIIHDLRNYTSSLKMMSKQKMLKGDKLMKKANIDNEKDKEEEEEPKQTLTAPQTPIKSKNINFRPSKQFNSIWMQQKFGEDNRCNKSKNNKPEKFRASELKKQKIMFSQTCNIRNQLIKRQLFTFKKQNMEPQETEDQD